MEQFKLDDIVNGMRIVEIYRQKNSYNGIGLYENQEVFFKITDDSRARLEPDGYRALKPFFPQPAFLDYFKLDDKTGMVLFERIPELEKFENLLGGWMRSGISPTDIEQSKEWNTICKLIQNTNEQTLSIGAPVGPVEYHSRNKVKKNGKLDKLYGSNWEMLDFLKDINGVIIDDKEIYFNWNKYKAQLRDFGTTNDPTIKSISHGTLSELNLSILPLFFDVTSAGNNPVMADVVCFYLSISFTDDYIVPKFLPDLVPRFPEILNSRREEYGHYYKFDNEKVIVEFPNNYSPIRDKILSDWYSNILNPLIDSGKKLFPKWDWRNEFTQYSILRTLALFKLHEIDLSDQSLIVSYMARLHDWKENPGEYHKIPRIGRL